MSITSLPSKSVGGGGETSVLVGSAPQQKYLMPPSHAGWRSGASKGSARWSIGPGVPIVSRGRCQDRCWTSSDRPIGNSEWVSGVSTLSCARLIQITCSLSSLYRILRRCGALVRRPRKPKPVWTRYAKAVFQENVPRWTSRAEAPRRAMTAVESSAQTILAYPRGRLDFRWSSLCPNNKVLILGF